MLTLSARAETALVDRIEDSRGPNSVLFGIARTLPPNVVARELRRVRWHLCGSPEYLEREGTPTHPANLSRHNCLTYTHFNPQETWRLRGPDGDISVPISGNLRLNDDEALSAISGRRR